MARLKRHLLFGVSGLLHTALLLAFLASPPPVDVRSGGPDAFAVSLLAGRSAPTSAASTPSQPSPDETPPDPPSEHVEPIPAPVASPLPYAEAAAIQASVTANAAGSTCQLAEWLQSALRAEPAVLNALESIPQDARSVAGAIMLWDGRWVRLKGAGEPGLAVVRTAVAEGVRVAPEDCRGESMRGPTLLTIPLSGGVTLLAIGSGEWRWNDLLEEPPAAPTETASRQRAKFVQTAAEFR